MDPQKIYEYVRSFLQGHGVLKLCDEPWKTVDDLDALREIQPVGPGGTYVPAKDQTLIQTLSTMVTRTAIAAMPGGNVLTIAAPHLQYDDFRTTGLRFFAVKGELRAVSLVACLQKPVSELFRPVPSPDDQPTHTQALAVHPCFMPLFLQLNAPSFRENDVARQILFQICAGLLAVSTTDKVAHFEGSNGEYFDVEQRKTGGLVLEEISENAWRLAQLPQQLVFQALANAGLTPKPLAIRRTQPPSVGFALQFCFEVHFP